MKTGKHTVDDSQYPFEKEAADFCKVIKCLAEYPDSLESLKCYLSCHFQSWLERYADTPEDLVACLAGFAAMGV